MYPMPIRHVNKLSTGADLNCAVKEPMVFLKRVQRGGFPVPGAVKDPSSAAASRA
jgi:hypothetical protein